MLKIASDPKNISTVEIFVRDIFNTHRIKETFFPDILISVTEALNNAIIHGNREDRKKFVRLYWTYTKTVLNIKVCDEGCGFCVDDVPDPTEEKNILKIGGRGVYLIHQLCDKVSYSDSGSTVEMEFHVDG